MLSIAMIVRRERDALVLVTQPDHAALAADLAREIRTEEDLLGPHRDSILLAVREHDNGWREVDAAPTLDPVTAQPYDFVSGPAHQKLDVWPRGVARAADMDVRAGALVAEHALTVYAYRAGQPEWQPFFTALTAMRDDLLDQLGSRSGARRAQFEREYRSVRLADIFSLTFCAGWTTTDETFGYRTVLRGTTVSISPDPFRGATVPLRVAARRIAARRYADDIDLRHAIDGATPAVLTGVASSDQL